MLMFGKPATGMTRLNILSDLAEKKKSTRNSKKELKTGKGVRQELKRAGTHINASQQITRR